LREKYAPFHQQKLLASRFHIKSGFRRSSAADQRPLPPPTPCLRRLGNWIFYAAAFDGNHRGANEPFDPLRLKQIDTFGREELRKVCAREREIWGWTRLREY
jgi:hypothetical protein